MNYPCRVLLTKNILKEYKKNLGCLRLNFDSTLSLTAGSWFLDNLSTNNSKKIRQILKSLLGMSTETKISHLMKKPETKNIESL